MTLKGSLIIVDRWDQLRTDSKGEKKEKKNDAWHAVCMHNLTENTLSLAGLYRILRM